MNKSIAQLRRYNDFLKCRLSDVKREIIDMTDLSSLGIGVDNFSKIEYINSVTDIIGIIKNEITVASLQESIKYNDEEISLEQANRMLVAMKDKLENFISFRHSYVHSMVDRNNISVSASDVSKKMGEFFNEIKFFTERIYDLNDKIKKAEENVVISVDMSDLIVALEQPAES